MARVEEDAEERIAEVLVDDGLQRTADLADVERLVPRGDGSEIRPDELVDVVADALWQLGRVLDDEPGATGEGAPDSVGGGERVAALDRSIAGAQEAVPCSVAGGQHEVA